MKQAVAQLPAFLFEEIAYGFLPTIFEYSAFAPPALAKFIHFFRLVWSKVELFNKEVLL